MRKNDLLAAIAAAVAAQDKPGRATAVQHRKPARRSFLTAPQPQPIVQSAPAELVVPRGVTAIIYQGDKPSASGKTILSCFVLTLDTGRDWPVTCPRALADALASGVVKVS